MKLKPDKVLRDPVILGYKLVKIGSRVVPDRESEDIPMLVSPYIGNFLFFSGNSAAPELYAPHFLTRVRNWGQPGAGVYWVPTLSEIKRMAVPGEPHFVLSVTGCSGPSPSEWVKTGPIVAGPETGFWPPIAIMDPRILLSKLLHWQWELREGELLWTRVTRQDFVEMLVAFWEPRLKRAERAGEKVKDLGLRRYQEWKKLQRWIEWAGARTTVT